jgi:hypothetical protein
MKRLNSKFNVYEALLTKEDHMEYVKSTLMMTILNFLKELLSMESNKGQELKSISFMALFKKDILTVLNSKADVLAFLIRAKIKNKSFIFKKKNQRNILIPSISTNK